MGRLAGRAAFITGASSGIGEAIAARFLEEGARVVGCGRRPGAALRHDGFCYFAADITVASAAKEVVASASRHLGGLDIVVNCAGITGEGSLDTTDAEAFLHMFQVNVGGVFNICKAAMPFLREGHLPSIVNVASDLGVKALPNRIAYCPSKAALIMLTRCVALEAAPRVRANCILPGLVETPMIRHRFEDAADPRALRESLAGLYPLKRMGELRDMASAAVFLAGEESAFITGTELAVCGGRLI